MTFLTRSICFCQENAEHFSVAQKILLNSKNNNAQRCILILKISINVYICIWEFKG